MTNRATTQSVKPRRTTIRVPSLGFVYNPIASTSEPTIQQTKESVSCDAKVLSVPRVAYIKHVYWLQTTNYHWVSAHIILPIRIVRSGLQIRRRFELHSVLPFHPYGDWLQINNQTPQPFDHASEAEAQHGSSVSEQLPIVRAVTASCAFFNFALASSCDGEIGTGAAGLIEVVGGAGGLAIIEFGGSGGGVGPAVGNCIVIVSCTRLRFVGDSGLTADICSSIIKSRNRNENK